MTSERPGVLGAIGNTPVVPLSRLVEPGMAGARIATLQVDSGLKYLSGELYT